MIADNKTAPGKDCLDKEHVYETFNAIMRALQENDYNDINALFGFEVATNFEIIRRLKESMLDDGPVIMSDKLDKDGNVIGHELKLHPALQAIPKLTEVLGLTPKDAMLTPKAVISKGDEDEGRKTMADVMADLGRKMREAKGKRGEKNS